MADTDSSTVKAHIFIPRGVLSLVVKLKTSSTILQLKQEIEARTGIEVARQTLLLGFKGLRLLEDSNTISHYHGLNEQSFLVSMTIQPLPENVRRKITVSSLSDHDHDHEEDVVVQDYEVKETDTVLELKRKMEENFGAVAEDMILYRCRGWDLEMENCQELYKYYIREGSKLVVKIINQQE